VNDLTAPIPTKDLLGKALKDYISGKQETSLQVFSDIMETDEMPVNHFFRTFDEMPDLEKTALDLCRGKILDVGAGAGCHSNILQAQGMDVTALEISPGAIEVLKASGIKKVSNEDFFNLQNQKYDTLLLLMNGIGLAGKIDNLDWFFTKIRELLNPGGQVLLDSSDIIYLYENEDGSVDLDLNSDYYGEMVYRFGYDGEISEPFDWLYVDFDLLSQFAEMHGFKCEMLAQGSHYDYLARLSF
jgi:hypothetical protein